MYSDDSMNVKSQVFLFPLIILVLAVCYGCATQGDLETLQRDSNNVSKEQLALQRNLVDLNTELKNLSRKVDGTGKKTEDLQQQLSALSAETKAKVGFFEKEMETTSQPMRRYQADLGARLDKIQMDVQNLMGRFEESKYFAQKTFGETKTFKDNYQGKLDDLDKKIAALNKAVEDLEKKSAVQEKDTKALKAGEESGEEKAPLPQATGEPTKEGGKRPLAYMTDDARQTPSKKAEKIDKKAVAGPDEAYKKAYDLYTKGNVDGARVEFKKFLEAYPKSKYAENSHFWLGECYYAEKKYDEAILEFDEVIKNFPKGNKVPDALLRQGMAFLEMKDTTNAKLILKEVVKRFPKSDQAKKAQKKLKEI